MCVCVCVCVDKEGNPSHFKRDTILKQEHSSNKVEHNSKIAQQHHPIYRGGNTSDHPIYRGGNTSDQSTEGVIQVIIQSTEG